MTRDRADIYREGASKARESLGDALGQALDNGDAMRAAARKRRAEQDAYPPCQAGGAVWTERRARREEFQGGAVCWDPAETCEGICRICPRSTP